MTESPEAGSNGVPEFDFSRIEIKGKTLRFDCSILCPGAYLTLAPAHPSANPAYARALRDRNARRRASGEDLLEGVEAADLDRRDDRLIYPETICLGWTGIRNRDGEEVEATAEARRAWFAGIPDWFMDRIRSSALVPERFLPSSDAVGKA